MSNPPSAYFIFVQLGDNPSPTLNRMASLALSELPGAEAVLISDNPRKWLNFPGLIIKYRTTYRSDTFVNFVKRNRELEGISGGYWLYTLERLFALKAGAGFLEEDTPIIHLESDVLSMVDEEILKYLISEFKNSAIPRFSPVEGIASILFSPSINQLSSDLNDLELLLVKYPTVQSDMKLLGVGLQHGIFRELPSNPRKPGISPKILFDGAAYGQYIFGQDPVHNNGIRKSGYRNPHFDLDLQKVKFKISHNDLGRSILQLGWENSFFRLANLHIHSKEEVPNLDLESEFWYIVLDDANRAFIRKGSTKIEDVIHSKPIKFADRLRRARKIGYVRQASRILRYRVTIILKRNIQK